MINNKEMEEEGRRIISGLEVGQKVNLAVKLGGYDYPSYGRLHVYEGTSEDLALREIPPGNYPRFIRRSGKEGSGNIVSILATYDEILRRGGMIFIASSVKFPRGSIFYTKEEHGEEVKRRDEMLRGVGM